MVTKLELEPAELDVVMKHLAAGQWQVVQAVINKIMNQANDRFFQSPPQQELLHDKDTTAK